MNSRRVALSSRFARGRAFSGPAIAAVVAGVALLTAPGPARAQAAFPYGEELLMDADPLPGSEKIPSIDILANGLADIELWCNAVKARLVVAGDTVTVLIGPHTERICSPERTAADQTLLAALNQATGWTMRDDTLTFTGGPQPLRFRLQRN